MGGKTMTTPTDVELAELDAAEREASEAPWRTRHLGGQWDTPTIESALGGQFARMNHYHPMHGDAKLIALSRNLARPMLDLIREQRAESERLKSQSMRQLSGAVELRADLKRLEEVISDQVTNYINVEAAFLRCGQYPAAESVGSYRRDLSRALDTFRKRSRDIACASEERK